MFQQKIAAAKSTAQRKKVRFNPDRKYVENAITEYISTGGKITIIEMTEIDPMAEIGDDVVTPEWGCDCGRLIPRIYPEGFWA